MSSIRNLLSQEEDYPIEITDEVLHFECINGYFMERLAMCYCYPGWDSVYNSLVQCTIDTGLNNTKNKNNDIYTEQGTNSPPVAFVIFLIVLFLFLSGMFCHICMCLCKKYIDMKLIREKIKYFKKTNKKLSIDNANSINQEEIVKDINGINEEENNKENENEKDSVCLGVVTETEMCSFDDKQIKE